MLQQIITTLDQLVVVQKQLIEFAEQKRTVLIERNISELNLLVKQEARLIKQLGQLDQEREELVNKVLKVHPDLTFSQWANQVPEERLKKELQLCMEALQETVRELQTKNRVNERLLQDSMSFVQHMIEQVTKTKNQNFNYQSPLAPQKPQTSSRGFFDTKA